MSINGLYSWIITIVIAYITYYIVRLYMRVKLYPPGPTPLPVVGNVLMLRGLKKNPFLSFIDLKEKYGNIYTFWMGNLPTVFITDVDLAKEAFNKSAFSGRPQTHAAKYVCNERYSDIIFADYSKRWESLRRVTLSAVRKFAISEKLPDLTADVIDEVVNLMHKTEGNGNPFNPLIYIQLIVYNIIASTAFGKKYSIDDPEFIKIDTIAGDFHKLGDKLALVETAPIFKYLFSNVLERLETIISTLQSIISDKFYNHLGTYHNDIIRDFTDALISAKNEALSEEKESAQYLTNDSLIRVLWNLFIAGTDTTQFTTQWMLLIMADKPEIQRKLREEIETEIGQRIPIQDDKLRCHYITSFISEVMRFRNAAPIGVMHRAVVNSEIGKYKIPKDTMLFVIQYSILNDPKYWTEPETFNPKRFLNANGVYASTKPSAFIPFGIGRRICLGEKLASADLFLILVRLLQNTMGYEFTLSSGPGTADLEPDPNSQPLFCFPKQFNVILKKV